ncbi:CheW domain-containing protein [Pseudomonas cremoricolorata]|uniref:CheW domain-containing protein n=1 Tax=Pseudomonas cremoricolorata TaxID=157783 RepID=UPI0004045DF8|nr:CheW domain-containing protein [Pseudomonas cremoricolorata]
MSSIRPITSKPQLALQSYLDGLLQDATEGFDDDVAPLAATPESGEGDEFAAAVREEQRRDADRQAAEPAAAPARPFAEPAPSRLPELLAMPQAPLALVESPERVEACAPPAQVEEVTHKPPVAALAEVHLPAAVTPPPAVPGNGRPAWAAEPFECLLFDVAGLTLAVPLVCLGSIYPLAGQDLTPLFGQPDWFLGILTCQGGNLKVLDTARWVMPDRYRDDFRQGLQYVISVQGYEWGLAVHQVSRSLRLDPDEIKWRSQRGQRPWLAGTVIEHMCALLDVAELAELIASGAVKQLHAHHQ